MRRTPFDVPAGAPASVVVDEKGPAHGWTKPRRRHGATMFLRPLAVAIMLASMAQIAPTVAAETLGASTPQVTTTTTTTPLDVSSCAFLLAAARSRPEQLPLDVQKALPTLKSTDCSKRSTTTVTTLPAPPIGVSMVAASTGCQWYYKTDNFMTGPFVSATAHIDIPMCWNGTNIWQSNRMSCYFTAWPIYGFDIWDCNVWGNNSPYAYPGFNYDVFAWSLPTYKRYGWEEFLAFGSNGASNAMYGNLSGF